MDGDEHIVIPGEALCKEEEYLAYRNVYVDDKGTVRAAVLGRILFDSMNRRVSVKPFKELKMPRAGDVVVGYVSSMKDDIAHVEVVGYDLAKPFKHSFMGILHLFQVVDARGDSLYNYVRLGDIVKVRVLNSYIPLLVTMREPRLGVILAFCSRCGRQLYQENDRLVCPACNSVENRKRSPDYMLVKGRRNAKA